MVTITFFLLLVFQLYFLCLYFGNVNIRVSINFCTFFVISVRHIFVNVNIYVFVGNHIRRSVTNS